MKKTLALSLVFTALIFCLAGCSLSGTPSMDELYWKYGINPATAEANTPYEMSTEKPLSTDDLKSIYAEVKDLEWSTDMTFEEVYAKFGVDPNSATFNADGTMRVFTWMADDTRDPRLGILMRKNDDGWTYFDWNQIWLE